MPSDPGWTPAIKGSLRSFLTLGFGGSRLKKGPLLIGLRSLVLSQILSALFLLGVLTALGTDTEGTLKWFPFAVVADGIFVLWLIVRFRGRYERAAIDDVALASAYRPVFFLCWALNNSVLMMGFVGYFLAGQGLIPYLVAIPFALVGLYLFAPTRERIRRWDREHPGEAKLSRALLIPVEDLPQPAKK